MSYGDGKKIDPIVKIFRFGPLLPLMWRRDTNRTKGGRMYTVKFEIEEEIVDQIHKLSTAPGEELASRYLSQWLTNGRHTMFEARRITVAWPTDWWAAMIKHWEMSTSASRNPTIAQFFLSVDHHYPE